MKKKQLIVGLAVLAVLVLLLIWGRNRIHFDFAVFRSQLALANWGKMAIGLGCIYLAYVFRSARWALLMRHIKRVPLFSLLGTQVMGFTAVALIGRVADLTRPYLVARKTKSELSSQVAIYIVERLFDAGAMALVFSLALLQVSQAEVLQAIRQTGHMSFLLHRSPELAADGLRYGALVLTLLGALFLVGIRLSGELIARIFERAFGLISKELGHSAGHKIRTFHSGLDTIRSFGDFAAAGLLSLSMWVLIAAAYFTTMRAFTASPALASINVGKAVLMMLVSGTASTLMIPVIGWFSQIGIVAWAVAVVTGAGHEAAVACAACILLVTFLGIIPVGLVWAQFEDVSLRSVTVESEQAGERLIEEPGTAE
ncbi:MAG: lysylphosphatidylglycerol synthase transmembrane domain-containing protein [Acidobacteriota bacterium]